jgi:hypothetical protein
MLSETDMISSLVEQLRRRLPAGWAAAVDGKLRVAGSVPDAMLVIGAGRVGRTVVIEVRSRVDPRDVPYLCEQLRRWPDATPMVVAPFLSVRTREELVRRNLSYADSTGNLRLVLDEPALFIETTGATANPYREARSVPLQTLKGPSAARTVRALCDFRPPYGVRELAARANVSPASVSRVADLLERDALLERGTRGAIAASDWPGIIRRWAQDYSIAGSNRTLTFLEPRGLPALRSKLAEATIQYAVTGSLAASLVAPVAPARLLTVYVANASAAAAALGLREAESGANVLLLEPIDPVAFERTWSREGIAYSSLSQVAVDLLTSPGRGPAEGVELIRWMEANEAAWRA